MERIGRILRGVSLNHIRGSSTVAVFTSSFRNSSSQCSSAFEGSTASFFANFVQAWIGTSGDGRQEMSRRETDHMEGQIDVESRDGLGGGAFDK